jgi:hypothetical protein
MAQWIPIELCMGDLSGCIPESQSLLQQWLRRQSYYYHNDQNSHHYSHHHPFALELGTGIGAPSIALAKTLERMLLSWNDVLSTNPTDHFQPYVPHHHRPLVVATDVSPQAQALTIANARWNQALVNVSRMDYFNTTSVQEIRDLYFTNHDNIGHDSIKRGFAMVIASSLQELFQDTHDATTSPLWDVLDILLDPSKEEVPAMAILVHTRSEPLREPTSMGGSGGIENDQRFRLLRRISGSDEMFGNMKTRWGDESDFEICIFQRRFI